MAYKKFSFHPKKTAKGGSVKRGSLTAGGRPAKVDTRSQSAVRQHYRMASGG